MKLNKIVSITATLKCLSGLHIGAGDSEMHIGGVDNSVVKHPLTLKPYIPGSSIKGKMRSLLEWRSGAVKEKPLSWKDYQQSQNNQVLRILQLFGIGASDSLTELDLQKLGPTRLSFWDCDLTDDYVNEVRDTNVLYTEVKSENSINRISGVAENPRQTERVPANAAFKFKLTLKELEGDTNELINMVLAGLKLLEMDSLGGSGSRGYGKICFEELKVDGADYQTQFNAIDPFKG